MKYSECHLARNLNSSEKFTLSGGRNNLLALAQIPKSNQSVVIKGFPKDHMERFSRETFFLTSCESSKVTSVPRLLDSCAEHQVVVMTHEFGEHPIEFSMNHEKQMVEFLLAIQNPSLAGDTYPEAIEAVWSTQDFTRSLQRRIVLLRTRVELLESESVTAQWLRAVQQYMESSLHRTDLKWLESMLKMTSRLSQGSRRFLSPSDLGMHNCLTNEDRLVFLDFEYAGADSGINLVGDLVMQPDSVWSSGNAFQLGRRILNELFGLQSLEPGIIQRLFGLRWSLIMLLREQQIGEHLSLPDLRLETQSYIADLADALGLKL